MPLVLFHLIYVGMCCEAGRFVENVGQSEDLNPGDQTLLEFLKPTTTYASPIAGPFRAKFDVAP
jgi:hypothetical protein